MAIRGIVGAVYESDAAPISENVALLFDWTLEVQHRKEYTYGPELHGIPTGWHVKAEAYWAPETMPQGQYFVRLFIGKFQFPLHRDPRCNFFGGWDIMLQILIVSVPFTSGSSLQLNRF